MDKEIIASLEQIVGAGNCRTDADNRRQHGYNDAALPDAVVYPGSSEEVAAVMRLAGQAGLPVVPWGAGSMARRGLLPLKGGLAVNLTRLNRVLEFDHENMTATVEAGIGLQELQQTLKTRNLFWPVEPVEQNTCTAGGCVATDAGGPSKLGYGNTRFHILGLEVVLPTGEVIRTGGKTVKNVQDYDNTRFLAGSWGSLGIITRIILKLRPLPEKETTVFLTTSEMGEALAAARTIRDATLPVALEFLDGQALKVMARAGYSAAGGAAAAVLASFNGFSEQVEAQVAYLKERYPALVVLDEAAAAAAWQARRQLFPVFAGASGAILASAAVPFTAVTGFITRARELLDGGHKGAAMVAHFGNAHVHIFLDADPAARTAVEETIAGLDSLAAGAGGMLVVDNIDDTTLSRRRVEARGAAMPELLRRLKTAFDPQLIMAPNSKVLAYIVNDIRAAALR